MSGFRDRELSTKLNVSKLARSSPGRRALILCYLVLDFELFKEPENPLTRRVRVSSLEGWLALRDKIVSNLLESFR